MRRLEPCHCFQALSVGDCEMWLNHVLQKQVQQITLAIQSAESFSVGWSSLWLLNLKEDLPNISVQSCSRCVRVNNQRPLVPVFIDSLGLNAVSTNDLLIKKVKVSAIVRRRLRKSKTLVKFGKRIQSVKNEFQHCSISNYLPTLQRRSFSLQSRTHRKDFGF